MEVKDRFMKSAAGYSTSDENFNVTGICGLKIGEVGQGQNRGGFISVTKAQPVLGLQLYSFFQQFQIFGTTLVSDPRVSIFK